MSRPSKIGIALEIIECLWGVELPEGEFVARRDLTVDEERLKQTAINVLDTYLKEITPPPIKRKPRSKKTTGNDKEKIKT